MWPRDRSLNQSRPASEGPPPRDATEFVYIASKDKSETYARDVKQTTPDDHAVEAGHTNKVGLHLHEIPPSPHTAIIPTQWALYTH